MWQERVEIPTYETGLQDTSHVPGKSRLSGIVRRGLSYGVTDTLSEQKTLKSGRRCGWKTTTSVMILPELGGRVHRAWDK